MKGPLMLKIDRVKLLEFYDTKTEDNKGHAAAINAVAGEELAIKLLKRYFEKKEKGTLVEILNVPCTQKTKKGKRLDRWLYIKHLNHEVLYQVEIKNWSSHSLNGKPLALDATPEIVSAYKKTEWKCHWNNIEKKLTSEKTGKVLEKMVPPEGYTNCEHKPLLCMWGAMHPEGKDEPFFVQPLPAGRYPPFMHLYVFSLSAYLRTLDDPFLEIEMPEATKRVNLLKSLFLENS
jgi:hypothetical protein